MNPAFSKPTVIHRWILATAFLLTIAVYWPGLHGSFLFDDYPNIIDNHGVQPADASVPSLVSAALSSPASDFKRPLASLSFAVNYLAAGLDPFWMKLTNLVIHLVNGLLIFLLATQLAELGGDESSPFSPYVRDSLQGTELRGASVVNASSVAALIAALWMLLPINLTAVLYVVQRMESMANAFVVVGLIGYIQGRKSMLGLERLRLSPVSQDASQLTETSKRTKGFLLCLASTTIPTMIGALAKETAVMLPLYALLIEAIIFRFSNRWPSGMQRTLAAQHAVDPDDDSCPPNDRSKPPNAAHPTRMSASTEWPVVTLFGLVLGIPMIAGLAWLLPSVLEPATWATRDFTLHTRLLSEARIVVDYIRWTLLPTPGALSFYHDNFRLSTGLLAPWTTLASIAFIAALFLFMVRWRRRRPLVSLGLAFFLGCQLLTGTILPLELIYEHRNYFASFGLLLAVVPVLAVARLAAFARSRRSLLAGLAICWVTLTGFTAYEWGNPLRLAEDLAARAPDSPRAQYELGRTYIIYSHYDPASPFTKLAYAPLERAAALPNASILAEQALIFMNSRMHLPLKEAWWKSMTAKLAARPATVQDESSLEALVHCANEHNCDLPSRYMLGAFTAVISHANPSARFLAIYGDYAWNGLNDRSLGLRMTEAAVKGAPRETAYRISLIRMLAANGQKAEAQKALLQLDSLNIGGRLDASETELRALPGLK